MASPVVSSHFSLRNMSHRTADGSAEEEDCLKISQTDTEDRTSYRNGGMGFPPVLSSDAEESAKQVFQLQGFLHLIECARGDSECESFPDYRFSGIGL
jgi:hypothetical protein